MNPRSPCRSVSLFSCISQSWKEAVRRLARVLTNDPGTEVMRHADASYEEVIACAKEMGVQIPMR